MKSLGLNFTRSAFAVLLIALFVSRGDAKLKELPAIKSFKNFSIAKNNVSSVKYTVYEPVVSNGAATKGNMADFAVEIFFDASGNRTKEIVYHIETGKIETITSWSYNQTGGTVVESRTNARNEPIYRIEYLLNKKAGTVLAKKFESITDKDGERYEIFVSEELWSELPKSKAVSCRKTLFSPADGKATRQSLKELPVEKPFSLYTLMDEYSAPVDCVWLSDYLTKLLKTTSGKSRKEKIFDGTSVQYAAKKKLLVSVKNFGTDRKLTRETAYSYELDANKNWVKLLQKNADKPEFIVERTINYR
ncbi:MAG: hypothetical protein LBD35_06770 [Prevotellaceae bacterium]|jgi:hypothetical protein|nr:hypothetical protein [Prevotellaceae bacterium]